MWNKRKESWMSVWQGSCDWNGKDHLGSAKCKQWVHSCSDSTVQGRDGSPCAGAGLGELSFPLPPLLTAYFFLCHGLQWCRVFLESVVLFAVIALQDRVKIQPVPPETHSSKSKPKTNSCWRGWWGSSCCEHSSCWIWEDCWGTVAEFSFQAHHAQSPVLFWNNFLLRATDKKKKTVHTLEINTWITSFHENLIVKLPGMSKSNQTIYS